MNSKKKTEELFRECAKTSKATLLWFWGSQYFLALSRSPPTEWHGKEAVINWLQKVPRHTPFPLMVRRPLMGIGSFMEEANSILNSVLWRRNSILQTTKNLEFLGMVTLWRGGGIDTKGVEKASANGGSDCKGIIKPSGYSNTDSIGNCLSSFIHKVRRSLCNKKFRQQSVLGLSMQGGTNFLTNKFMFEQ